MALARLLAPLFLFELALTPAVGQTPAQSNARYTLRGSVVNSVTGEPIRKAWVEVAGAQAYSASSGPDGQFRIEGLPSGGYSVMARRPGYMDSSNPSNNGPGLLTSGPLNPSAAGILTLGPDTGAVVIKLVPLAKISGRVLDTEGEPVPNLMVQTLQQSIISGHKRWQSTQAIHTDDGGSFLIDNLSPGKVLLTTHQQQVYPGLIADDQASRLIYCKQYYPNSPDPASAQAIDLNPGEEARADMTVSTVRGTRVFFSVTPAQPWVTASLIDATGSQVESQVRRNVRTEGWILPSVPPGPWRLSVRSNGVSGEAEIDVGATDLENVVVPLSPQMQVPILFTGGGPVPPNVRLLSSSATTNFAGYNASPALGSQEGHFIFPGVVPGAYHLLAGSIGTSCIESITSGSADLSRTDYVVAPGSSPQPINVGISTNCAALEISSALQATQSMAVVIVGGVNALEPLVVNAGNSANVKLSPGDYDLFAFSNLNDIEYANPEILRNFAGQHVSLSPNQTTSVRLNVIIPGESR